MRFDVNSYDPMTLREVGKNLGLTRERVRQLEGRALGKRINALRETTGPSAGQGAGRSFSSQSNHHRPVPDLFGQVAV